MTTQQQVGRLAVLGAGKMGEALIRGLTSGGVTSADRIVATAAHQSRLDDLAERLGVGVTLDNCAAVESAEIVLLCVKPQTGAAVLRQIASRLTSGQLLVSILAGVGTRRIESLVADDVPVVRAMPNTPSLVRAGMTALCGGSAANGGSLDIARRLFEPLGRTIELEERHFDAVTGLSASGPAFVYLVIEALTDGGVKVGLPRHVATELAAQACLGAAAMVLETGSHPALLKDDVTTPAGCTADGLLKLEEGGLRVTLIKAVVESQARAGALVPGDPAPSGSGPGNDRESESTG